MRGKTVTQKVIELCAQISRPYGYRSVGLYRCLQTGHHESRGHALPANIGDADAHRTVVKFQDIEKVTADNGRRTTQSTNPKPDYLFVRRQQPFLDLARLVQFVLICEIDSTFRSSQ